MCFLRLRSLCVWCCAVGLAISRAGGEESWLEPAENWLSSESARLTERARTLRTELRGLPVPPVSQQSERIGWHSTFVENTSTTKWLQVDLGQSESFDAITLVPVDVAYGAHAGPGFGFPVRLRVEVSEDVSFSQPRLLAALDEADLPNPGYAPVFLATPAAAGRFVRITATRLWPRGDRSLFALGEIFVWRAGLNLAAFAPVAWSDAYNNPPAWQPSNATDGQTVLGAPVVIEPAPGNGWHARTEKAPEVAKWVQVDLGEEFPLDELRLFPARPKDFPARRGFGFPVRFRVEVANDAELVAPRTLADFTQADFENPAESAVLIPARGIGARFVRVTATRLWARTNDYIFALAELEVWSGARNVALGQPVTSLDTIEAASWSRRFLVDGFNSQGRIVDYAGWLRGLSRRREVEGELRLVEAERERLAAGLRVKMLRVVIVAVAVSGLGLWWWMRQRARARRREVEQLRQRIAGDLHDEIGSNLGSIALLSQMALRQPGEARADLAEINRVARETAESMRDLVWFIKPAAAVAEDFVAKLRETAAAMLVGMEWTFDSAAEGPWALEFKRQVFLIFKEALHNVRRHANASRIEIRIAEENGQFVLQIGDNGCGFEMNGRSSGHGLASMQERAKALGGAMAIESCPGAGTWLILKVKMTSQWRVATA